MRVTNKPYLNNNMELKLYEQDGLELVVDMNSGESFATISGYARMANLTQQAISKRVKSCHNQNGIKKAKLPMASGSKSTTLIPEDIIADWIFDDNPKLAKQMLKAGVRLYIHGLAGIKYQPKKDYSPYLLKEPRQWTKVFGDAFYDELSRLTGLDWDRKTHKRPCRFAYLTRYYVYDYLPEEVVNTLKASQKEHGGYIHKMHQFLSVDGLEALKHHLVLCLNILEGSSSLPEAKRLINQAVTKQYQLNLFDNN